MVNESDVQKLEKGRKDRQRQIQRLGIVEFKRRNAEQKAKERLRKIQTLGKSEYDRIINERAKNRQKKLILKLGTKLFLQDNPNTALPSEVVLIGIGNAERLRLNRIKDKKNRDAIQERGIERLGADEYWKRVYARRKKHRKANPAMDEARKARLRTPEKRSQYAKYAKTKREKIGFRIGASIRGRVAGALYRFFGSSKGKGYRQGNSLECFGCSIDHLMFHFQQLFAEGMSFSNYGNGSGEWNVDHILCVAYFNKELENGTPREIKAIEKMLNHFTNLVPLWSNENRIKNDTFPAWVKDRGCCFWTDLHEQYYKLRNYDVYLDETIDKDIERQIEDETRYSARTER